MAGRKLLRIHLIYVPEMIIVRMGGGWNWLSIISNGTLFLLAVMNLRVALRTR
jgi:hypothetical protein